MPTSGGPKENHRSTKRSTMRFDTSNPPVILTSDVRKEIWYCTSDSSYLYRHYGSRNTRNDLHVTEKKSHCSIYPLFIRLTQQINSYATKVNCLMQLQLATSHQTKWHPLMALPYPQSVWFASLLDRIPELIILVSVLVPASEFQCRHKNSVPTRSFIISQKSFLSEQSCRPHTVSYVYVRAINCNKLV